MWNGNAVKSQLLGMPFGTATGQLKKALVFHLAGKLGLLSCYRCQKLIETVKVFSIEHTESWQYADNPVAAFFDVEKIAFSHLDCNSGAGERPSRVKSPEGMSWCYTCKKHLPIQAFPPGIGHNRLFDRCTECSTKRTRNYRKKHGRVKRTTTT